MSGQPISTSLVEQVSAAVHQQWINTKLSQGVTSRRSEIGEELMVPYELLSEPAKDLDRMTVVAVLGALQSAGYSIAGSEVS